MEEDIGVESGPTKVGMDEPSLFDPLRVGASLEKEGVEVGGGTEGVPIEEVEDEESTRALKEEVLE